MKTSLKALPLAIALTACGGGGGSSNPAETPVKTEPPAPTIVSEEEYCIDTTLYKDTTYSDGTVEKQLLKQNAEECGYVEYPEFGTPVGESYCGNKATDRFSELLSIIQGLRVVDRLQDYADGEGGTYTEKTVSIDQTCFVQMEKPADCPTTRSDTGDSRFDYLTCDGIKQKTSVSFPYEPGEGKAIIDMLIVFDSNITEADRDGMSIKEFVDKQVYELNKIYLKSEVNTLVRVAGIQTVEVAPGDLYRQYSAFFNSRYEFQSLDDWQRETNADMAFLFKKRPEDAIACGVASLDATRGLDKSRGIAQCFHNSVFQENATTRYYERAHETFAHEVGHLLGAQHEYRDANTPGLFEYSFGYNIEGYNANSENPDYMGAWGGYGTIMSYADLPTGQFSSYDVRREIPETGQSVRLGEVGGCFCLDPIEDQPPATHNVNTIIRTRWLMSQLHEHEHAIQFSTKPERVELEEENICLF